MTSIKLHLYYQIQWTVQTDSDLMQEAIERQHHSIIGSNLDIDEYQFWVEVFIWVVLTEGFWILQLVEIGPSFHDPYRYFASVISLP
ncbi:hypothetical protein A4A49_36815 [Nicotiana attenuata]|uniref:Uncharacterized protein n=1 Tax=Nicotiana attenuata TaxID=49451 RepID=A0A1J6K7V3_NICAT|nr:hypothetical protein A4A49_36815 [Nicotiana attenuata]